MDSNWQLFLDSLWPLTQAAITASIPLAVISFAIGLAVALLMALMVFVMFNDVIKLIVEA